MKIGRMILILIAVIAIILFIAINIFETQDIEYNNTVQKEAIITVYYSKNEINRLISKVERQQITLKDIKSEFKIECLRKTKQGYYVVLLQSDGSSVFVFADNNQLIYNVMVFTEFLSKEDFELMLKNEIPMTISDVSTMDKNTIPTPLGLLIQTIHIVKGGVILITYSPVSYGSKVSEPIVQKIEYINYENLASENSKYILKSIPIILEIDKN